MPGTLDMLAQHANDRNQEHQHIYLMLLKVLKMFYINQPFRQADHYP
jgi:hypothetical protein